jgi:hypothetical protein
MEESGTRKDTLGRLSRIWALLSKGDGKEKGDKREDMPNVYLCELAYRSDLGEGHEGYGGEGEKMSNINEVAGGELSMSLEFTTEGWYLRCNGVESEKRIAYWRENVASGEIEDDDDDAVNYIKILLIVLAISTVDLVSVKSNVRILLVILLVC